MKKFTLSLVMITIAITVLAQAPQAFKYQAVARDNAGNVLANQNVSFQISILQGSAGGPSVYTETHNAVTNEFGLVNLEIGTGTVVTG
nr:collagen-like protein [Bacteroidota bacterium]